MAKRRAAKAPTQLAEKAMQHEAQGNSAAAARFFRLAGEQALKAYDHEAAVTLLTQALARTPDNCLQARFELLLIREGIYALQGNQETRRADLASLEQLAEALGDDTRRAEVAVRQAEYRTAVGDYDAAGAIAQMALRLSNLAGSSHIEAAARLARGTALLRQGNYAASHAELAVARDQVTSGSQMEADVVRAQGLLALNRGELPAAHAHFAVALAIYRQLGDRRGESTCLNNLGHIAYNTKRFTAAGEHWEEALTAHKAMGDRQGQAMVLVNMGAMFMDIGEYAQAKDTLDEALALCRQIRSRYGEGLALLNLGLVQHYLSRQEEALESSRDALAVAREIGSRRLEGYAQIPVGHALLAQGQTAQAKEAYWDSLAIWHELGQPALEAEMRAALARVALAENDGAEAFTHVEAVLAYLAGDEMLEGTESPFRVYLTCFEVLDGQRDERAQAVLDTAHSLLQARAKAIADEPLRLAYLENVAAHKQLATLAGAIA